ncbi:MTH938/NDUFAF3 family protein [Achromobacter xylosoxidans]
MPSFRCAIIGYTKPEFLLKLHTDPATAALNTVTAYGDGYIEVNQVRFPPRSLSDPKAKSPPGPCSRLPTSSPAAPGRRNGRARARPAGLPGRTRSRPYRPANAPEVLLVGTGARQRFLRPEVLRPLLAIGVGVEVMDTHAASRTYNILMAEGRRVVVALIPPNGDSPNDAEHRQTRPAVHYGEHHRPDQP